MNLLDVLTVLLLIAGMFFFLAGTVGVLRFPDVFTRLHALTKADNLGLGLVALALIFQADSLFVAIKLLLAWLLLMFSSSLAAYLVANAALRHRIKPWRKS